MTARVEYRVVVERDGQQWPLPNQHNEPMTDPDAAEAYRRWVENYGHEDIPPNVTYRGGRPFDRVFVVAREVLEAPWIGPDGCIWDEQAARDRMLEKANERRYG